MGEALANWTCVVPSSRAGWPHERMNECDVRYDGRPIRFMTCICGLYFCRFEDTPRYYVVILESCEQEFECHLLRVLNWCHLILLHVKILHRVCGYLT